LKTRTLDAGFFASIDGGRIGRGTMLPPQLGQRPLNLSFTHSRQNVHSNEQIIASAAAGSKSLLQHSQLGRSSSIFPLIEIWFRPFLNGPKLSRGSCRTAQFCLP
jgi:hypothetical protein